MSLLNVSALQNVGAGVPNILLNSDGSVTLPVYTNAGTPPVQFQAGTLWYNGTNLQIRNAANTSWVAIGGGGGSGTVTAVSGTAPINVATPTTTPVISIAAATTGAQGSIQLATAAEAAAGTDAVKAITPAYSVPKDAATMTGAAILPAGTDLQRAAIATPVVGMQRYNTTSGFQEVYTGATLGWQKLAFVPSANPIPPDLVISANTTLSDGIYVVNNLTINSGVTVTVGSQSILFVCYGSATINGTINADAKGGSGAPQFCTGSTAPGSYGVGPGSGNVPYSVSVSTVGTGGPNSNVAVGTGGGVCTSSGGRGGGSIGIKATGTITVGSSAVLTADGGNAANPFNGTNPFVISGAGGGSGGSIILHSLSDITLTAGSSLTVTGGNGGNAAFSGSLGGAGTEGEGGKGGGGGVIILQAQKGLTDASTKVLTGGTDGTNAGTPGTLVGAVPGAAFGGSAGSAGLVLYAGSPF
jgi:hypothetical protein